MLFYQLSHLLRSMSFHISYSIFQWFVIAANNHVDMAWHNAPGKNLQSFLLLTVLKTLNQFIFVFISCKHIFQCTAAKLMKYILLLSQNLYLLLIAKATKEKVKLLVLDKEMC